MGVRVNLKAMESMIYFWEATKSREKVGESYIQSIAELEEMKPLYGDGFSEESVRKVLSAISNREVFEWSKPEGRFWNNNMWMLEDMALTRSMLAPIKVLNLDQHFSADVDAEIVFIPGHLEPCYVEPGKLTLNFFRVQVPFDGSEGLLFEGAPLETFISKELK